jgi:hypothetical protein
MTTDDIDSAATLDGLMRVLRRYADSPIAEKLSEEFAALAKEGIAGLVAFEEGSHERIVESVLAGVHQKLALLVLDLNIELGTARLEARRQLDDIDPSDFGGTPW